MIPKLLLQQTLHKLLNSLEAKQFTTSGAYKEYREKKGDSGVISILEGNKLKITFIDNYIILQEKEKKSNG